MLTRLALPCVNPILIGALAVLSMPTSAAWGASGSATVQIDVADLFNSDVIVNSERGVDPTQSPIDAAAFGASNSAFVTQSVAETFLRANPDGLPDDGFFSSSSLHPDVQLSYPRRANNARRLMQPGQFFVAMSPGTYEEIHLFATSGQGSSMFQVHLQYQDGIVTAGPREVPDWFDDPVQTAERYFLVDGMDRAKVDASSFQNVNDAAIFGFRFLPDPSRVLEGFTVDVTSTPRGVWAEIPFEGSFCFFGATALMSIPEPATALLIAGTALTAVLSRHIKANAGKHIFRVGHCSCSSQVVTVLLGYIILCLPHFARASENLSRVDRIRSVAISNLSVPQMPAGVEFREFVDVVSGGDLNAPALNNAGQTVFFAKLAGDGVTPENDGSLWLDDNGRLQLLAREGQPAPGAGPGINFTAIHSGFPAIADDGSVVFGANVGSNPQQFDLGIWVYRNGVVAPLVLENRAFPSRPVQQVTGIVSEFRINDDGQIATWLSHTNLRTGIQNSGLYLFSGEDQVETIAETGRSAPGTGRNFKILEQDSFALNDAGEVAFVGAVEASGIEVKRDSGVWLWNPSDLQLLVREGEAAPGVTPPSIFEDISQGTPFGAPLSFNHEGTVAVRARLAGSSLTNRFGLWTIDESGLKNRLLESTDPLPGYTGVGIGRLQFDMSKPPISMNASGQVAFIAELFGNVTDQNELAILRDRGNGLEVVARTGNSAPGTPAGSVFRSFSMLPSGLGLNAAGAIAFRADYVDYSTYEGGSGIWVSDGDILKLIVRTGDVLEVSQGISRVVSRLAFLPGSGNADGQRSGFDDIGRIAFHAEFTDGSEGIFVSNLIAVPEPSVASLMIAVAWICHAKRL